MTRCILPTTGSPAARHDRRGFTLLELLVVIFIISLLSAVALRTFRPAMEKSQVREASRILSSVLSMARSHAQENRLGAGVMFLPFKNNSAEAMEVVVVASPPPYSGDTLSSRIRFKAAPAPVAASNPPAAVFTVEFPQADAWTTQVAVGDVLQFNNQGHRYTVQAIDNSGANPKFTLSCSTVVNWPVVTPTGDPGVSFQFFHKPRITASVPVQLPAGAVVDLLGSGMADESFAPTASEPVMVTFSPTGLVDQIYAPGYPQGRSVTDNVYFLIGRPEGAGTSDNLADLRSLWVTVTSKTGLIGIDNNAAVTGGAPNVSVAADRKSARRLAATGTGFGG